VAGTLPSGEGVGHHFAMKNRFALAVQMTLFAIAAGCSPAQSGVTPSTASQSVTVAASDSVPSHETFTIQSATLGEMRKVNVYLPPQYVNNRREFPVLYMPDGGLDEDFPHVARTVDSLISLRAIRPIIVVGIPNTQRRRDLTGPTRIKSDSAIAPKVGGSAEFRRFIRYELIPDVAQRYRVSPERGIIGESLAGYSLSRHFLKSPTSSLITSHSIRAYGGTTA
jgi:Predicted hydrolase of the alpha/beta superfamily